MCVRARARAREQVCVSVCVCVCVCARACVCVCVRVYVVSVKDTCVGELRSVVRRVGQWETGLKESIHGARMDGRRGSPRGVEQRVVCMSEECSGNCIPNCDLGSENGLKAGGGEECEMGQRTECEGQRRRSV